MDELRFFGTDVEKTFAVFEIDRKDAINLYLWVFPEFSGNNRISIEYVTRIFSYLNHTVSPFYVKEEECADIINKSLKIIDDFPKDVLKEKFKKIETAMDDKEMFDDDWFKEWDEAEEKMNLEVQSARSESGFWPWKPD